MADPEPSEKGGGGHPDPEMGGEGWSPKTYFLALWASVWSKNKRGGCPPSTSPRSATGKKHKIALARGVI